MCRHDPLVAVTHDGSSWSKVRKMGRLEVSMLTQGRCNDNIWDEGNCI